MLQFVEALTALTTHAMEIKVGIDLFSLHGTDYVLLMDYYSL